MAEEKLYNPVQYIGACACYRCGSPLYAADSELSYFRLNQDGEVEEEKSTVIDCRGVCPNCKIVYPLRRSGFGYRIYSKTVERDIQFQRRRLLHKQN